jgi:hypothetical protein
VTGRQPPDSRRARDGEEAGPTKTPPARSSSALIVEPAGDSGPARRERRDYLRQWRHANLEQERARGRAYTAALRARVLAHYGTECACCGTADDLTIDHRDGRGREHREALFGDVDRAGRDFYRWLARQGFPQGYWILCRPCNSSKGRGECCRLDHGTESQAAA